MTKLKIKKDDEEITLVDEKDIEDALDEKVDNSDLSNYIQKSSTTGLVKNDGSIDTATKLNVSQGSVNASKNVVTDVSGNITTEAKPTIPTKTSQLTNDSNFTTATGHNHDSTYIKKTGGVSQNSNGNIIIPSASDASANDATGKIPFAGHLTNDTYTVEGFTTKLKSFIGGLRDKDSKWWNVISARQTNGGGSAGENNGLILKSLLSANNYGDLIWDKQYNSVWMGNKTILDSSNYSTYASPKTHTHTKLVSNGSITDGESLLIDYTDEGIYTVGSTTAGAIQDTPYTGNYSCLIENKYYGAGSFMQFCYKMPGSNITEIYYRKKVGDVLTGWRRIAIKEDEPEYVTSTHASGTNTWTGTCANITKVEKGTQIFYRLGQNPTTDNVTLNLTLRSDTEDVVTTGVKNVYIGEVRLTNQFDRYSVIHMVYNGSNWMVLNGQPKTVTATITYADGSSPTTINFVTR